MIPVTKSFLPPIAEYNALLQRAWNKQWLTNRGELVLELEQKLKDILNVPFVTVTNNGTVPLQIALKLFGNGGEIITTPFSYVATTAAVVWENCTPIFADIHPEYWTLDEAKIEDAITLKTTAILATHVFGNACNIEVIAKKHNLKVIYDGAHCFGVKYKGDSIFNQGDISTCSFHATKLFHTAEGGAMFCKDAELQQQLFYMHNFGHNGPEAFHGLGINGKMSELQAAMGLAVFPYLEEIISSRKRATEFYDLHLDILPVARLKLRSGVEHNYAYYPIVFETEPILLKVIKALNAEEIYPRRYFYPSLTQLPYVDKQTCEVSNSISKRVICLPLYYDIASSDQQLIVKIIADILAS
ncbi:MAG: DegT/DnrJ/EryC1/StrS family aminotransferase [Bacteroidota bacterium]